MTSAVSAFPTQTFSRPPIKRLSTLCLQSEKTAPDYQEIRQLLESKQIPRDYKVKKQTGRYSILSVLLDDLNTPLDVLVSARTYAGNYNPIWLAVRVNRLDAVQAFKGCFHGFLNHLRDPYQLQAPIHAVCRWKEREIVEILLQDKSCLKLLDVAKNTPAHLVAAKGSLFLLQLYADEGADLRALNIDDRSVLYEWVITRYSHVNEEEYVNNLEKGIDFLLSKGVDIHQKDSSGRTILEVAQARKFPFYVIQLLQEKQAQK